MTTLAEVLAGLDDAVILDRLAELYSDESPDDYRPVLATLRAMAPTPGEYELVVRRADEDEHGEDWIVLAYRPSNDTEYAGSFIRWAEWLGMVVRPDVLEAVDQPAIMAHVLWEMTWDGFNEEQIQAKGAELLRLMGDAESGKIKATTPQEWEQVKAEIRAEIEARSPS